ncbi:MAG: Gfo/Idh/MocA family oxidoreductase [Spirochaetaceae bacterium]|jgi:predicted dehydrogenase|nr:Gfo/Idh/MocA family oxidoreductase [Spirochaetaceae bacterium]
MRLLGKKAMKAAVIGLGAIAPVHIAALQKIGVEIVAVCDSDGDKKALAQTLVPDARFYADDVEMMDREALDSVHICTPHYLHPIMCVSALERDIHVLCEKPLAISEEGIAAVRNAQKKSKATVGVCFQNRYLPENIYAKKLLKDRPAKYAAGMLLWKRDNAYYRSAEWRGTWKKEGGGVLINQAIHTLDMLSWLVGHPNTVTADLQNVAHKGVIETEDNASCYFQGNGFHFHLFATTAATNDFSPRIVLSADDMTLSLENGALSLNGEAVRFSCESGLGKPSWGSGHTALIEDFYTCLRSGTKFPIDVEESVKAVELVLACYRSRGQLVRVGE